MNRIIEIIAMALGGISLLTVCFLGFALMSGTPLSDVGVIGKLFPEPDAPNGTEKATGAPEDELIARPNLSEEKLVMNQAGLMHAWQLPSPFDAKALGDLTERLKMRDHALDVREVDLDQREARLDDQETTIEDRIEGLVQIQGQMEKRRIELEALGTTLDERQQEVDRKVEGKWAKQAGILEAMDLEDRNKILGAYEPEEMAQLLKYMEESTRGEVMAGLQVKITDPVRLRAYLEAYGEIAADAQ